MTLSVLLVDDNPFFLRILNDFLSDQGEGGVKVLGTVVGGREALAQAERLRPEVIVVDLKMPDCPGLQLLPKLRTALPGTILIALSLLDPDEYREETLAAGADAFVSKVSLERDLIPAIQELAARGPRRGTTTREG